MRKQQFTYEQAAQFLFKGRNWNNSEVVEEVYKRVEPDCPGCLRLGRLTEALLNLNNSLPPAERKTDYLIGAIIQRAAFAFGRGRFAHGHSIGFETAK